MHGAGVGLSMRMGATVGGIIVTEGLGVGAGMATCTRGDSGKV